MSQDISRGEVAEGHLTMRKSKNFTIISTLPKTNMDTQNDGLEKVTPLKNGNCWYL